jgi:hypothetical protein
MLDKLVSLFFGDTTPEQRRFATRLLFRGILVVHVAWACGWLALAGLPLPGFAQASDVDQVKRDLTERIDEVKHKVDSLEVSVSRAQRQQQRTTMETEVRRLEQEIFNIEARMQELTAAGLRPDRIYGERLSDLKYQKSRVEARLRAFMVANPDIAGDIP